MPVYEGFEDDEDEEDWTLDEKEYEDLKELVALLDSDPTDLRWELGTMMSNFDPRKKP